jgi:hypothetical protein
MFGLGPATKIYVGVDAAGKRKGFEVLYGLARCSAPLVVHRRPQLVRQASRCRWWRLWIR